MCGDSCQKVVATLMARVEALTSERDSATARILELEDDYTDMVNDYRRDLVRMQATIDQLTRREPDQPRSYPTSYRAHRHLFAVTGRLSR